MTLAISRRAALIGAAALAAAPRAPRAADRADVVIVGAGVSGLYAAQLMVDQGFKVVVLEGRDRVGGRLLSFRHLEGAPEAGGDSILGGYGRVRDACSALGLNLVDFEQRRGKSGPEIALRGSVIPRAQWASHPLNRAPAAYRADFPGRRVIEKVIDANNPLASAGDWIEPASVKFDTSVYEFLSRLGWSDDAIALNYDINIGRGTSAHDCSVLTWFFRRAWDNLQTEIENVALKVVGGNQALPEAMAAKLGDVVRVNVPVTGIRSDAEGVEARSEDGAVHRARFAICATPITPLRWIKFDPLLPPVLAEAIAQLPSMRITKVFLNAKRPFWDDDGLSPAMWTDTAAGEVAALRQAADSDRITGLIARVRGYASAYLDTLGERDAGAAVVAAIESLRPVAKGQLEVAGYKSWAVDRFSGGTWAEWEPGQVHRFLPELVKPAGRIHFAGEHASLANRGMEAAMEAGERAALEVMARL